MAAAAILKNHKKSRYQSSGLTDLREIWHSEAGWPHTGDRRLKFRIFQKPRWRRPQTWKSQKSPYLLDGLTDLYDVWHHYAMTVKNLNFQQWRPPFWKNRWIVVSQQPLNRFWWNLAREADWTSTGDSPLKFRFFQKTKMAAAAILKITKIAISPQRFDRSLRNLAPLYKMGLLTVLTVKKIEFPKSKMADSRHFKNR